MGEFIFGPRAPALANAATRKPRATPQRGSHLAICLDLPNVPTRLGALIDSIVALDAHTSIIVAQITPTQQDPLNARNQAYNAAILAVVKARADAGKHVALVDMYSAFVKDPAYKSRYLADRLHPNAAGYRVMSDTWNTVVHDLLH